jgi:hypothetical protein
MSTEKRMNDDINSLLKLGVPREYAELIIYSKNGLDVSQPIDAIKCEAQELKDATKEMVEVCINLKAYDCSGCLIVSKENLILDNSHNLLSNLILNDKN